MKVALGYDVAAYDLEETFRAFMTSKGCEGEDLGAFIKEPAPYSDIASAVAAAIAPGRFERQTLFCGAGIGMDLAANKTKGIRAAQCHDTYSDERARPPRRRSGRSSKPDTVRRKQAVGLDKAGQTCGDCPLSTPIDRRRREVSTPFADRPESGADAIACRNARSVERARNQVFCNSRR